MKVFNNHIALFTEAESIVFFDKLKDLVNNYLEDQLNESIINYSRFNEEKFNKFTDILYDNEDYFASNIIDSYGNRADKFNINEVEMAIKEIEDAIQITRSFSSSNKELVKLVHKSLNKFNIIPDDNRPFNDYISASEIKSLIKLNSDSVHEVLTSTLMLNFHFINELCNEAIEEMRTNDDNPYKEESGCKINYFIPDAGETLIVSRGDSMYDDPELLDEFINKINNKVNNEINRRIISKCDAIVGFEYKYETDDREDHYQIPRTLIFKFDLQGLSLDEQLNAINSLKQISKDDDILDSINEKFEFSGITFDDTNLFEVNSFIDDYRYKSELQK